MEGGEIRAAAKMVGISAAGGGIPGMRVEHYFAARRAGSVRPVPVASEETKLVANNSDAVLQKSSSEIDECVFPDAEEAAAGERMPRVVFASVPTPQEAKEATSELSAATENKPKQINTMDTPPRSATKCGHIPAGIVEEILLNLPVQSLLRFSSVSKSWDLMINEPWFSKKYRGRKRMILRNPDSGGFKSCHLSAAVSNNPIEEATYLNVFKFDRHTDDIKIRSVCDGLLFLESQISLRLFIWNPSNRKFHELPLYPFPTFQRWPLITSCEVYYGLGYDFIGDDY